MSREVEVQFEVRNMAIMRQTLEQMGITFNEVNAECIEISRSYHNIRIDAKAAAIAYDEGNVQEVNTIKQNYMNAWYTNQAILEGNEVEREVKADGSIEITVLN